MRVKSYKKLVVLLPSKRSFFVILLSLFVSFSPMSSKKTAAWTAIPSQIFKQTLEKIDYNLNGIIMGTLKMQAARIIDQQVSKLIGGTVGSGAMFITNWESFLVNEPQRQADKYVNDYLSQLTRGRGSYSSYVPYSSYGTVFGTSDSKAKEGFFGGKVLGSDDEVITTTTSSSGNYYEDLLDSAKKATTEKADSKITYEGDPSQALSEDTTFRKHNEGMYGLIFKPLFVINARNKAYIYRQNQEKIAANQSIAYQGFIGTTKNGIVITPGSLTAQAMANVEDLGNKIIASATHPAEIISSVVSSVITKAMLNGIGAVSSTVDRQINQVTDKVTNTVNQNLNQYGPGVLYNGSSSGRSRY